MPATPTPPSLGAALVAKAKTALGKPYIFGAMGPNGFDCSGLVNWAAKALGIKGLPRTSQEMRKAGQVVPLDQIAVGDLVTFSYTDRRGDNPPPGNHVAIYAGGGQVVQASGSKVNVGALDTKHIDRVIRLDKIAKGGGDVFDTDGGGGLGGGGTVRSVTTMQQAGYAAAPRIGAYGTPVNPFKLAGFIAAGSSEAAGTAGGVEQASLSDALGGGGLSVPWDGVSTMILSAAFVLGGVALVVVGGWMSVRGGGGE
jgi:cell wall-associated NlpC family hydrolase